VAPGQPEGALLYRPCRAGKGAEHRTSGEAVAGHAFAARAHIVVGAQVTVAARAIHILVHAGLAVRVATVRGAYIAVIALGVGGAATGVGVGRILAAAHCEAGVVGAVVVVVAVQLVAGHTACIRVARLFPVADVAVVAGQRFAQRTADVRVAPFLAVAGIAIIANRRLTVHAVPGGRVAGFAAVTQVTVTAFHRLAFEAISGAGVAGLDSVARISVIAIDSLTGHTVAGGSVTGFRAVAKVVVVALYRVAGRANNFAGHVLAGFGAVAKVVVAACGPHVGPAQDADQQLRVAFLKLANRLVGEKAFAVSVDLTQGAGLIAFRTTGSGFDTILIFDLDGDVGQHFPRVFDLKAQVFR